LEWVLRCERRVNRRGSPIRSRLRRLLRQSVDAKDAKEKPAKVAKESEEFLLGA